jgi:hypothetical protein
LGVFLAPTDGVINQPKEGNMAVNLSKVAGPKYAPKTEVPKRAFENKGYGVIQVPHAEWDTRIVATTQVQEAIQSRFMPAHSEEIQQHLSLVKGMFSRVYVGDCYDWYTTASMLGFPSAELSKELSTQLAIIKGAIREQNYDIFDKAAEKFQNEYGLEMLDNYLDIAARNGSPVREQGWAYILWSSSEKDILHIGTAGGDVYDVLRRLNNENRDHHPYGVLAAWLVHDPVEAYNTIYELFDKEDIGNGYFRVALGEARTKLDEALKLSKNFALSPWHEYDENFEIVYEKNAQMKSASMAVA